MFRETQASPIGLWVIMADGQFEITSVNVRSDLERMLTRTERYALLVCIHSWSNYSKAALESLEALVLLPIFNGIALGMHSLDNAHQLELVDAECYRRLMLSLTEPALFLFDRGVVASSWFGQEAMTQFASWLHHRISV